MTPVDVIASEPLEVWRDNCVALDGYDPTQRAEVAAGPATVRVFDHLEDRWRIFPTTVGDYTLRVSSRGESDETTLRVVANLTGAEPGRSAVFYGDSLTAAANSGGFVDGVKDAVGAQLTLFGTQGTTYKHEGYAGKTWDWFRNDVASPLTASAGVLDIAAHLAALGGTPDFALWNLGTNDLFSAPLLDPATWEAMIDTILVNAEDVLAAYSAAAPAVKHGIGFTWPGAQNDAVWVAAGYATGRRWLFRRAVHRFWERLISQFEGREASGIYLIATHLQIDPVNDYPPNDPVHFTTATGHPRTARMMRHWLVSHW